MKDQITKAIAKGNFVRALVLSGYTITQVYYRKDGRQECDLVIRSNKGYEGRFESASQAWDALQA